ncbi:probable glycosyltransferase At5g03795 [Vicia villosa]|uniref:probable glycosyltransferase At5g03795 n=1 Tax=Vicia villosa TaxID=3911 RepID=UPI00273B453F|nr:probable glycosyltransferase At5g03795 [Vicia villosa]
MGEDFVSMFHLETKRLLWLIGITFSVILAFQYLELPYGNVFLSLFSSDKLPTSDDAISQTTYTNKTIVNNVTIFDQENSTDELAIEKGNAANDTVPNPISGFVLEPEWPQNKSQGFHDSATNVRPNITTAVLSNDDNMLQSQKENVTSSIQKESFRPSPPEAKVLVSPTPNIQSKSSSISNVPKEKQEFHKPISEVTTVSEMNKLLIQSHASYRSMKPSWFSNVDQELLQARSEIENAPIVKNDPELYGPIYHNVSMFKRSYELMEEKLKVYVYREGARPILHSPFLTGIYASEGWFMKLMEANKRFVTKNPKKAHLFYLPFSSRMLEETLYVKDSHNHKNLIQYLHDYVDLIATRHSFWNRTGGADHFLVGCHDWAPSETKLRLATCIRSLCNADVKEGFFFGKDASLPETYVRNAQNPTRDLGGNTFSKKTTLAFFAGSMHGYVRPILLKHWENKDPDMKIFGKLPKSKGNSNYIHYMKSSKYCICARGYEVNSPRVVEAIFYECVPVIISDNFVPPFFEVLNWESFTVVVLEKDIPNLKNILVSIPEKRYLRLLMRVKKVQKHFLWHKNPVKYDIFHMILHSIWYNRVFSAIS